MYRACLLITSLLLAVASPAGADVLVQCPDMAKAERVGNCPTKGDLRHYFKRTCQEQEDDQFRGASLLYCSSFKEFMKAKDIAMWEAKNQNGAFQNYIPCAFSLNEVRAVKSTQVQVECSSKACAVHCGYEKDLYLTLKPMENCRIDGDKAKLGLVEAECGPGKRDCAVRCD